ncbi:hypothetical protein Ahy_B04g071659 [Arachis hypogaea]|uniref:Uncharacterized protein n=1 Tax=Arachis hypogaea TaxID=3818 RepID=A0A444ZL85_ARAHY|nr:hypothetical protein Ahy_B04g071659 [Arachis hypogaea]
MQLKNKLSSIKIENSVNEYVLALKGTIDALASVGEQMRESDNVNAILNGLTKEPVSISVGELEALLLTHERMLERFRKQELFVQANMAQYTHNYNMIEQGSEEIFGIEEESFLREADFKMISSMEQDLMEEHRVDSFRMGLDLMEVRKIVSLRIVQDSVKTLIIV